MVFYGILQPSKSFACCGNNDDNVTIAILSGNVKAITGRDRGQLTRMDVLLAILYQLPLNFLGPAGFSVQSLDPL